MSSAAPGLPLEAPLSQAERIMDTFVAPTKTFMDLRRSANWLVPFLLIVIATIAVVAAADTRVGFEKIVDNQLQLQQKQAERLDKLSPEDRAKQMDTIVRLNRTLSYISPVFVLAFLAIIAGVLLGTFNFGLGTELKFNQCMAVCMYASLPSVLKAALSLLVIFLGAADAFTFQNPIASNLSPLVSPNSHFLYNVAVSLDVFTIWTLVLSGIGFSCLTKVKRGTSMAVVFGWWAAFVLATSGVSAAFS